MVCRKRKTSTCHFKKHPPPPRAPEAPTICHVIPRTPPQVLERGSLLQINVYLLNPKDVDPCPPQPGAHTTPE